MVGCDDGFFPVELLTNRFDNIMVRGPCGPWFALIRVLKFSCDLTAWLYENLKNPLMQENGGCGVDQSLQGPDSAPP
jgi:hypothetical protein